jgi:CspA family cold shock protein
VPSATVRWFNAEKGYGFLALDDGGEVFVSYLAIEGDGFRTLRKNQRVSCEVVPGDRGPEATRVRLALPEREC